MKRRWIIGALFVVLAMGAGILFWKKRPSAPEKADVTDPTASDGTITISEPGMETHPSPLGQSLEIGERAIVKRRLAKKSNGRVKFYVRVIDQYGAPVSDAVLSGAVSAYNEGLWVKETDLVRTEKFQIRSDEAGQVAIADRYGYSMNIDNLTKDSYLWRHPGFGSFGVGGEAPTRIPSHSTPAQPLVLHMWKKGPTELIIQHGFQIRPFKQDAFGVNLVTGQMTSTNEPSDLVFRFPRLDDPARAARAHRLMTLEVPDGGILEATNVYPYAAAQSGYQPSWQWVFLAADTPPGKEDWSRNFYIRARSGRVYAGLKITFDLPTINIEAIVNPAGSRVLEPDPAKQITDPEEIQRLDEATRVK